MLQQRGHDQLVAIATCHVQKVSTYFFDVAGLKAQVFAYSAALAGLAGALYAHHVTYISADSFRADFSILMVVIVAVGGKDSFWGAALGSVFLTVVPQYLRTYEQLAMLLYGLILIVVFMYLPGGLVSLVRGVAARFGAARGSIASGALGGAR